jgi:hypothetical protein
MVNKSVGRSGMQCGLVALVVPWLTTLLVAQTLPAPAASPAPGAHAALPEAPAYPGHHRLVIPRVTAPMVIDGKIGGEEWAGAAVVTGLSRFRTTEVVPEEERVWFYLAYDAQNLYLAMRSANFPVGSRLVSKTVNQRHPGPQYEDQYSYFIVPFADPLEGMRDHYFKFVGNPRHSMSDQKVEPPHDTSGMDWMSHVTYANSVTPEYWEMEMAVPFSDLGHAGGPVDGQAWCLWLVRALTGGGGPDMLGWGGYDNLFFDPMPRMTFSAHPIVARLEQLGDPLGGKLDGLMALVNHSGQAQRVYVNATAKHEGKELFRLEQAVDLAPGARGEVPLKKLDIPVVKGTTITVTAWTDSAAGPQVLYQQLMSLVPKDAAYAKMNFDHIKAYRGKADYVWHVAYYDSIGFVRGSLNLDIAGMEEAPKRAAKWKVQITPAGEQTPAFSQVVGVTKLHATVAESTQGRLADGKYTVQSVLLDAQDQAIDSRSYELTVARPVWEGCKAGVSDDFVPPPYTPIAVKGNTLSVIGRTYELDTTGLPGTIVCEGHSLLASPMRLEATIDGKTVTSTGKGIVWGKAQSGKVQWTGKGELGGLDLSVQSWMEYDGAVKITLTLDPKGKKVAVENLAFIEDLDGLVNVCKTGRGLMYFECGHDEFMFGPERQGTIWESIKAQPVGHLKGTFNPAIYLGNPDRGLWWHGDSDQGWILDDHKSATTVVRRADGGVRLNQWLVNTPAVIDRPRTVTFMIQAVPPKPLPANWREISWGGDRLWGGVAWSDGFYGIGLDTPEQWKEFSKWSWASKPLYTATDIIGNSTPGLATYGGEWLGDSNTANLPTDPNTMAQFPDGVFKNNAGMAFPGNFKARCGATGADVVPSMVDCRLYYYEQGVKYGKLRGYWWDMDSFWCDFKPELGRGYIRDDGTPQGSYNYFLMRDMFKRMYQTAYANGVEPVNWHYYNGYFGSFLQGQWLIEGYYYMFSPNVDLVSYAPKGIWAIDSGPHNGTIPLMKTNFYELGLNRPMSDPRPTRAALMLCLLNDFGGYGMNETLMHQLRDRLRGMGFFDPSVRSIRHWQPEVGKYVTYTADDPKAQVLSTIYTLPNGKLLVVLGNMSLTPTHGTLKLRPGGLLGAGATSLHLSVKDAELDAEINPTWEKQPPDEMTFQRVWVGGHDYRLLLLSPR